MAIRIATILATLSILFPMTVSAGVWADYMAFSQRFYFLDYQKFSSVTCQVSDPNLDRFIGMVKAQSSTMSGSADVTWDPTTYQVTYTRPGKIKITDPVLKMTGVESVEKAGVQASIQINRKELTNLFQYYIAPNKSEDRITSLSEKAGHYTYIGKSSDGVEIYAKYFNDADNFKMSHGDMVLSGGSKYEKLPDGKLVVKSTYFSGHYPAGIVIKEVGNVTYQTVNGLVFPRHLHTVDHTTTKQSPPLVTTVDLWLNNCHVIN